VEVDEVAIEVVGAAEVGEVVLAEVEVSEVLEVAVRVVEERAEAGEHGTK
jgi:hypothetical protein